MMLRSSSLARGDIVLAVFPFADLSSTKLRPAVILGIDTTLGDFTLAFITSRQAASAGADEVAVLPAHSEFLATGLSVPSKIRAGKLVTLAPSMLIRRLGRLGTLLTVILDQALLTALAISIARFQDEGRHAERERLIVLYRAGGSAALSADLNLPASL